MLIRTHLAVGLAAALYFLPHMNERVLFIPVVLIASLIPELGNIIFSREGKHKKLIKTSTPFGGITRTYTTCIIASVVLVFIYPLIAFPFFLGYSFNLFLNAFTPEGITPFWPSKRKTTGKVSVGGTIDYTIFVLFVIFDIGLALKLLL